VTIRLAVGDFLWVVCCDHVSILHRYRDICGASKVGRTHAWADGRSGDFTLCPMLCTALDRQ